MPVLTVQNAPERAGENVGLRFRWNTARIQRLVISLQLAVELFQFAAEHIAAEDDLFEALGAPLGECGLATPDHQKIDLKNVWSSCFLISVEPDGSQ
jgi:hypothetical protein